MRRVFSRILSAGAFFILFYTLFNILIAYSTVFTATWEGTLFSCPTMFGGTYKRSEDMDKWLEEDVNDKPTGLILGGSTVYRNIDPYILGEKTRIDFFLAASSNQPINNSLRIFEYCINSGKKIDYVLLSIDHLWDTNGEECTLDWVVNSYNKEKNYLFYMSLDIAKTHVFANLYYFYIKEKWPFKKVSLLKDSSSIYKGKGFECTGDNMRFLGIESRLTVPKMLNSNKNALTKMINICVQRGIKIYLFIPKILNSEMDHEILNSIHVPIIDATKAPVDSSMYYDNYHLYCKGTKHYTEWIAEQLLRLEKRN